MGDAFIVRRGVGGSGLPKCTIIVHSVHGATVDAVAVPTAGQAYIVGRLTEIGTSGDFFISGLDVGTYYAQATIGGGTSVNTPSVTFDGHGIKELSVFLPIYFVKDGLIQVPFLGSNANPQYDGSGYHKFIQLDGVHTYGYLGPVNVSGYSKLKFKVPAGVDNMLYYGDQYNGCGFGIRASASGNPVDAYERVTRFTAPYRYTDVDRVWDCDISNQTGNYYVAFDFEGSNATEQRLCVRELWLEI